MIPDWKLPPGVDRGLWDYLHSDEMIGGYDVMMAASPLAAADVRYCEQHFPRPARLIDLGCGTGRLCRHFAARGFECVGVDLSAAMLAEARRLSPASVTYVAANLVDLGPIADDSFDYAACLFSTLGMVRGEDCRAAALASAFRVLKPGGRLVLHVHNRHFRGLGRRAARSGDVTAAQAYAGAALTLHHFSRGEAAGGLRRAGFAVAAVTPVGEAGRLPRPWLLPRRRAYGYLLLGRKPARAAP